MHLEAPIRKDAPERRLPQGPVTSTPAAAEGEASCTQEHTSGPAAVEELRQHAHPYCTTCLSQPVNTTTEVIELGDSQGFSTIGALDGVWSDSAQSNVIPWDVFPLLGEETICRTLTAEHWWVPDLSTPFPFASGSQG
jgi:hypothetical protein